MPEKIFVDYQLDYEIRGDFVHVHGPVREYTLPAPVFLHVVDGAYAVAQRLRARQANDNVIPACRCCNNRPLSLKPLGLDTP